MDNTISKENKTYTYEDLVKFEDENRYEIIDGELYLMSSPASKHQVILLDMALQFSKFFEGKKCRPFIAPLDVRLDNSITVFNSFLIWSFSLFSCSTLIRLSFI